MSMHLSSTDLSKIASLAKLELPESELQIIATKLMNVLDFVAQLNNADTSGVEELAHPVELHSVARGDLLGPSLSRESALQNAPRNDGHFFLVPPVLG
jgi:aspartyl-tRNA(Asn)/glutamyl-tRNA(Gln) amidotransferase subunit C